MKKISNSWITQWGKDYLSHLREIFQGKLTAGDNVTIDENNTISVDGVLTTVDETLDPASENPVENQAIYAACYGLGQGITNLQSNKVDKEQGKGLSSNDYTTTEKNKLNGIADNAEVNVQSDWNESDNTSDAYIQNKPTIPTVNDGLLTIQQNGTTVETFSANQSGNKIANIQVPTKTSDITNDSGFILNTVNNLTNYYLKSETYTRTEVANLISQAITGVFIFVQTLPTASASTMGKIYLVPKSTPETNNIKDEYITVEENSTYSWEHIGDTAVDLTGFVKYIEFNGGTYAVTTNTTTITLPDAFYTESEIDILIQYFLESSTLERVEYVQTTPSTYESDTLYVIDDGSDTHVFATISTTGMLSDAIEDSTHRTVTDAEKSSWNGKADASSVYTKTQTDTLLSAKADASNVYTKSEADDLLDDKVDKVTGKGLSTNDFTDALQTKLNGIATGAEVNVQADWNETDNTSDSYIQNKPSNIVSDASYVHTDNNYTTAEKNKLSGISSGAEVNVQSDWNQSDNTADDFIKNKPSIPTALSDLTDDSTHRVVTDTEKSTWNSKSDFSGSYNDLTNKPTIPDELADLTDDSTHRLVTDTQISTWNNKSDFSGSYNDLTNLPTLGTASAKDVPASGNASTTQVVMGDDTRLSDSRPASDVSAWAKASTKPTYNYSEIQNTPTIPDELADLNDDTTHRVVTDTQIATWNGKQSALTFDSTPTDGSTNPVTSDGIYDALSSKADTSDLSDYMTKVNPTGSGSLSINRKANTTVGTNSVAVGSRCEASGGNAFACGVDSVASGDNAHAEGVRVTASGGHSHAEGIETTASDYGAHAEGSGTTASNRYAHAEGNYSIASGYGSHAEGYYSSTNNKYYAHVEGYYTTAGRDRQSVCGQYNSLSTDAMFIVGNGASNSAKSNALEVLSDGRVTVGANPTGSMDAVPKGYLESKFIMISEADYSALTSYESNATYYVY